MKRDMDIVREILCKISDVPGKPDHGVLVEGKTAEEAAKILYHVGLLEEAGLLKGQELSGLGMETSLWADLDLTWAGHDFVDAIRDPQVWKETKKGLEYAGSFTFDLVKALAKGFVTKKIEEHTGVKLEF